MVYSLFRSALVPGMFSHFLVLLHQVAVPHVDVLFGLVLFELLLVSENALGCLFVHVAGGQAVAAEFLQEAWGMND